MQEHVQFYIDGRWVDPVESTPFEVIDPATEETIATISMGSAADVDAAVQAARRAFETFSQTTREERLALLENVLNAYQARYADFAETVSKEVGAPLWLSNAAHAASGFAHIKETIKFLKEYAFEELRGNTMIRQEPVGVCGFITPWNWPINQVMCKVAPALAAGCTIVLKPSEIAPLNTIILAEVLNEAGVPAGVFNLINGDGPTVGHAIAAHPDIDMVSFTGSTLAGIEVARAAAPSVKRVTQELGGKSANIILDDADFSRAIGGGFMACAMNSGQSCNAPTRMLVPASRHDEAVEVAKQSAERMKVGNPFEEDTKLGPVASEAQWNKIQQMIQTGMDEGATLVAGGLGRPEGFDSGYYVQPTVFANVTNQMAIAREEIFGPVLVIIPYDNEDDAVRIANDSIYGLAGYVSSSDPERAQRVARRLKAGQITINGALPDFAAPFGGYKQSGNGREWGPIGFREFLETKAMMGWS